MNVAYAIAGRLSLRPPQRNSLKILDRQEIAPHRFLSIKMSARTHQPAACKPFFFLL
jgi:hypothetical protein